MKLASLQLPRFGLCGVTLLACALMMPALTNADLPPVDPAGTRMIHVDWDAGFGSVVSLQANPGGIEIVSDPENAARKVLRSTIARRESYTHVANGTPRAELLFREPATFAQGSDYLVRWSTYIPRDFEFDGKQMVIISQIHQSAREGGPTLALTLLATNYYISTRGGTQVEKTTAGAKLCCADGDKGKWVYWMLRYIPDDSGQQSLTQLWKNGESVFRSEHVANAYPDDQHAYMKVGLYKAGWEKEPSDAEVQTLFYGPVSIFKR
ncbi:heparin lyase I family protein [Paraburkholderia sp. CNPSo 3076]|uniref:heparin lyase I family protein n=1 Tax=Paraburkholderia sp. CNPSo 3076 TaxID=2940936 RepID=UPI0022561F04|nr:heparin lyase I family protein [Paraburkholderia sp. CNPSo 3076]MCX5544998.1 heparin lyase I family protein [Paraburkholderia sp. CNPSo 3076]